MKLWFPFVGKDKLRDWRINSPRPSSVLLWEFQLKLSGKIESDFIRRKLRFQALRGIRDFPSRSWFWAKVPNTMLCHQEFSEHNALEDARATQRVYEEVKSRCSLDDPGMTKMCPGFDPRRDQVVPENDHTGVSSDFAGGEECLQQSPGQCDAVLKHRLVGLVHWQGRLWHGQCR